jgi:hypothetical protein
MILGDFQQVFDRVGNVFLRGSSAVHALDNPPLDGLEPHGAPVP